jgi:predicted CopG family antitoxin
VAKTIAVSNEVYKLLKRSKLPGESFSDVIMRGLRKATILEIKGSGTISRSEWGRAGKEIAVAERESEERMAG